jgi:hypothetical protein
MGALTPVLATLPGTAVKVWRRSRSICVGHHLQNMQRCLASSRQM